MKRTAIISGLTASALIVVLSLLSVRVAAAEGEYEGKSLDDWIARTQRDQKPSDRREAVLALGQIGTSRFVADPAYRAASIDSIAQPIVPRLIELLNDEDATIRELAARSLCWIHRKASETAIPALIGRLGDENERVRDTAASALCWRGSAAGSAFPALVKTVRNDPSPEVRRSAARALRTGGEKGVETVIGLLDDESVETRLAVLAVLESLYPHDPPYETPRSAIPKLAAQLDDPNAGICKSAAIALLRITNLPPEHFATMLRHKNADVRDTVATAILQSDRQEVLKLLPELLGLANGDYEFARKHAGGLWRTGPASMPMLLKLLDDPKPRIRAAAASALGGLGPAAKDAVEPLKRLLADETVVRDLGESVCHHAADALNRILGDKDYRQGLPKIPVSGK